MNECVTVDELLAQLKQFHAEGKGDYKIYLTNDEEANGYHPCCYLCEEVEELGESGLSPTKILHLG